MRLESVTLQNFRQYYGKQRLEFARNPQQNVTIVYGVNGAGKTSIFHALNWCLYGRKAGDIKIIENIGELMSKEAIQHAQDGDLLETSVRLTLVHNGNRYLINRSLTGVKKVDGTVEIGNNENFVMMSMEPGDPQAKKLGNPIGLINSILPPNVREYFLFDGEKIDNFAKPEAAEQVKQAIYLVLNIEILDRAQRHLKHQAREYRKQLKQISSGELRELVEKDDIARDSRENAHNRRDELRQQIELAQHRIEEIDDRLRSTEGARALQQRRDRLDNDIKQRRKELTLLISQLATVVTGSHVIFAEPAVTRALEILDDKRQRGEIPSGIRQQFVEDLLEQMTCICGRPLADNGPEHLRLIALLEGRLPGSIEDDILETNALLRTFIGLIEERCQEIHVSMQGRAELLNILQNLEAELDDVSLQLEGSPLEEISELARRRREFYNDIDSYNTEIGSLENQIDNNGEEIKQLEKEIARANKEQKQQQLLVYKAELAQQSTDAIAQMHHAFADDMRQRIETKTKEIFKLLVWKDSHFQDVQLGTDFNLEVIDRYGTPARPELSAGERQVLSLSFIAAMSQISEEEVPLVMDTPFGRLSSHHRNSITQSLPKLADQLVLFVTDEELRDQAFENLKPYIGTEYRLNFDLITSCTTIERV